MAIFQQGELIYIDQNAESLPPSLLNKHKHVALKLDLSGNRLRSLSDLKYFQNLKELIIHDNQLTDSIVETIPQLEHLKALSLNKNKLTNIDLLLNKLKCNLAHLSYLGLLGNPLSPDQLSGNHNDDMDYHRYSLYILYHLPHLTSLDFTVFNHNDRKDAILKGPYLKTVKLGNKALHFQSNSQNQVSSENKYLLRSTKKVELKVSYKRLAYVYGGKHSEGNRFIRNKDL